MVEDAVLGLFIVSRGAALAAGVLVALLAARTDIMEAIRLGRARSRVPMGQKQRRPQMALIVSIRSGQDVTGCLASIMRCRYRNLRIIVLDRSDDPRAIKAILSRFKQRYLSGNLLHYIPRRATSDHKALSYVHRQFVKGELVLFLDGDSLLNKSTLHETAGRFNLDPELELARLHTRPGAGGSPTAIWLGYISGMYSGLLKARVMPVITGASLCSHVVRNNAFTKLMDARLCSLPGRPKKSFKAEYLSRVSIIAPFASVVFARRSRLPNVLLAIAMGLEGVLSVYALYVFFRFEEPLLLFASWLVLGFWLGYFTLSDDSRSARSKLGRLLLVPAMFSFWYAVIAANLASGVRPRVTSKKSGRRMGQSAMRRLAPGL